MKPVAILTAAVAIVAATSAYASVPETHDAGGPIKQGNYCWSATNNYGAGFWHRCGDVPRNAGRNRSIVMQIPDLPPPNYTPPPPVYSTVGGMNEVDGSGDGGGGGGGGGGGR